MSSKVVASDKTILQKNKITHIVNCAGDICSNCFPDTFTYKKLCLKDAEFESIEAVFYDCIKFIREAK